MYRLSSENLSALEYRVEYLEKRAYVRQAMAKRASLRYASQRINKTAAGKPYLQSEGLTRQKVRDGEASMLYKIDSSKNQSKYYEMLIVQNPQNQGGYTLIKRYGRLGPRFQEKREEFKNLAGAKFELQRLELSKVKKGYVSAFGDYHRAPNNRKLPLGQYPVGLDSHAGSWANQSVISCKPSLIKLKKALEEAVLDAEQGLMGQDLIEDLESVFALTTGLEESMAKEVQKKLRKPLSRLKGDNNRLKPNPFKVVKELDSLYRYLSLQLSLCGEG
jgi:predicted DNA-binding WGR domain protein